MVVLVAVWCTAVAGVGDVEDVHMEGDVKGLSRSPTHVRIQPLKSCRRLGDILHLMRTGLDDLHALQETSHLGGRLLRERSRRGVRVRAIQWARKMQRRLLRLCPRQVGPCCCGEHVTRNTTKENSARIQAFFFLRQVLGSFAVL